jgi:hypothetical protein
LAAALLPARIRPELPDQAVEVLAPCSDSASPKAFPVEPVRLGALGGAGVVDVTTVSAAGAAEAADKVLLGEDAHVGTAPIRDSARASPPAAIATAAAPPASPELHVPCAVDTAAGTGERIPAWAVPPIDTAIAIVHQGPPGVRVDRSAAQQFRPLGVLAGRTFAAVQVPSSGQFGSVATCTDALP